MGTIYFRDFESSTTDTNFISSGKKLSLLFNIVILSIISLTIFHLRTNYMDCITFSYNTISTNYNYQIPKVYEEEVEKLIINEFRKNRISKKTIEEFLAATSEKDVKSYRLLFLSLAKYESGLTHRISPRNFNGTRDYGLFQVNTINLNKKTYEELGMKNTNIKRYLAMKNESFMALLGTLYFKNILKRNNYNIVHTLNEYNGGRGGRNLLKYYREGFRKGLDRHDYRIIKMITKHQKGVESYYNSYLNELNEIIKKEKIG